MESRLKIVVQMPESAPPDVRPSAPHSGAATAKTEYIIQDPGEGPPDARQIAPRRGALQKRRNDSGWFPTANAGLLSLRRSWKKPRPEKCKSQPDDHAAQAERVPGAGIEGERHISGRHPKVGNQEIRLFSARPDTGNAVADSARPVDHARDSGIGCADRGDPVFDAAEHAMAHVLPRSGRLVEPCVVRLVDQEARSGAHGRAGQPWQGILEADQGRKQMSAAGNGETCACVAGLETCFNGRKCLCKRSSRKRNRKPRCSPHWDLTVPVMLATDASEFGNETVI